MAKPEKRWQLLLVADDGRIIPFKRIKGIAVTLGILLVILGLACAGLGWQLTAEKVRHRRTLAQLTDANRQVVHYKSEHELITAELVLAEARMEKAGMLIPRRQARAAQQTAVETVDAKPVPGPTIDDGEKETKPITAANQASVKPASAPPAAPPPASAAKAVVPDIAPAGVKAESKQPAVAMDDLDIKHDAAKDVLLARFRVKNTGPRSSPVAGRCVVVLKTDQMDPGAWLAMPDVTLVGGKPDGARGQAFRISRFRDMEIKAMGQADPSSFKQATVYVFDSSGAKILEKEFPIDIPAPKPDPKPVSTPAVQPANAFGTTAVPAVAEESAPATMPLDQTAPLADPGEAVGNLPITPTQKSDAGAVPPTVPTGTPVDDPSLTEGVEPVEKEDVRSRF
ncbi:hypothetical protein [Desulfosarcina sp.]|uniref:hypothetical protein n=1 Tax=Desulfosarcina sp. TaxID=2027861 RepID=UPI0029B3492E|nr:hypothetical protein [Desulfosarcina sp.]MDX2451900.1 hypothetical protein [Desulfosarcina sp.]MDX2489690.1 hypothetical protein [Desulfosarcina sp.]